MPSRPRLALRRALLIWTALLAPLGFAAVPSQIEVVANADLTEEGRKIRRPTPEHPAYYVPFILGYHEEGKIVAGEQPPKRAELIRLVGRALAKEGYVLQALRPDANRTVPSLIVTIEWGYLNALVTEQPAPFDLNANDSDSEGASQPGSTDFNQAQRIALVAGSAVKRQTQFAPGDWEKLGEAIDDDRYFIIVSAYDFAASITGEQKLLWRTRMSVPRQGIWMNDALPGLIAAGAPLFGRQTEVPTWTPQPLREGRATPGELKVVEGDVKLPAGEKAKDTKAK